MSSNSNILRRSLSALMFLSLIGIFLLGNNASYMAAEALVTGKAVNIRSGPGLGFAKKALVFKGTTVQVLNTKGDWTEIKLSDGKKGWVKSEYIAVKKTSSSNKQLPSSKHIEITGKVVCLRKGPGTNYPVHEKVKKGDKLPLLEQSNGWFKVKTSKGIAYVAGWLARMVEAPVAQAATIDTIQKENPGSQVNPDPGAQTSTAQDPAQTESLSSSQTPTESEKQSPLFPNTDSTDSNQPEQEPKMTIDGEAARPIVVLDAGHGGYDPGAIGPTGLMEKEVNLSLVLKTASILEQKGYRVLLTRFDDRYLSLAERVTYVNQVNPHIFVSLHCNGANRRDKRGVSVYYDSSSLTDDPFLLLSREKLAKTILAHLVRATGLLDLGIQRSAFYVLRQTSVPAVLIETAFITNPEEEILLADPWFQDTVCHAVAQGIMDHLSPVSTQSSWPTQQKASSTNDHMSLDLDTSNDIQ